MTDAFPLAWPEGWPRTPMDKRKSGDAFRRTFRGEFGEPVSQRWSFNAARDALYTEVYRHAPCRVVLSSNFKPGRDGPIAGARRPDDEGIAIYFDRAVDGKDYVMACDRYADAEGNMRSLTLALEAMRQLERHGGGVMLERAFQGFVALPAPKKPHEIIGLPANASPEDVKRAHRRLIAEHHPDAGGAHASAAEINAARDAMLKQLAEAS